MCEVLAREPRNRATASWGSQPLYPQRGKPVCPGLLTSLTSPSCHQQEKRIYDLKKKNQELEKFKFVLDYKIKELKKQIEPRENEIKVMKEQIQEVRSHLPHHALSNWPPPPLTVPGWPRRGQGMKSLLTAPPFSQGVCSLH